MARRKAIPPEPAHPTAAVAPMLPPEAQELLRLIATRSMIIGRKFHRVFMSSYDCQRRLSDLDIEDDDLDSLLSIMPIDLNEIRQDLERIAELGEKLKDMTGDGWLRRQLESLGKGGT